MKSAEGNEESRLIGRDKQANVTTVDVVAYVNVCRSRYSDSERLDMTELAYALHVSISQGRGCLLYPARLQTFIYDIDEIIFHVCASFLIFICSTH